MSNRRDIQFHYSPHNKATVLDCNFLVASTAGAGVSSLNKSGRVNSVYMHSSAPASGNPNPDAGIIVVNLSDNYNSFLGIDSAWTSPVTGAEISISGVAVLDVGKPYVITTLGTTTQAQWVTAGLSTNVNKALGVSLIAQITGGGSGTGKVKAVASAGIDAIELVGNPNLMNSNGAYTLGAGNGMQLILACYTGSVLTAPADGAEIFLKFYMNNSAQGV